MRTLERGPQRESLDAAITSVAQTYGFTSRPVSITRNDLGDLPEETDRDTALIATLVSNIGSVTETTQAWATAKKGGGTNIVFAAGSKKLSIAQAFVVKAALATVESIGFTDPVVLISSVGDQGSRKRYVRELGNFFKRCVKDLPEEILSLSVKKPDEAARALIDSEHPLADSLPRTIDYLSESSRKIMLETISLFESLNIHYELESRLPYTPDAQHELIFAIDGTDKKGNQVRVATGGRFQEDTKKKERTNYIGMSVSIHEQVDTRALNNAPTPVCFVLHIGEAAKLRSFTLLDSLWRAHVAIGQALLVDTIESQMEKVRESNAKYVAIIGQREALDNTVILKNTTTELQETIPIERLIGRMHRIKV